MAHYKYLIIGGGMAADAAAKAIRKADADGSIGLISAETAPPYKRPPLSKTLWQGKPLESIWLKTDEHGVDLHLSRRVQTLDLHDKTATDDDCREYTFDKLLLATGGTPRRLPFAAENVIYFRTLDDYQELRSAADNGDRFAVIGGGFIGWEIAAALATNNKKVTMIFPESAIGGRLYPADLADFLNRYYGEHNVEVLAGDTVIGVRSLDGGSVVKTEKGRELTVDGVVAGLGIEPNEALGASAGLKQENGLVVDEYLRTDHPDVYAAGDVASFHNPVLDKRMRVEHVDNSVTMGKYAGAAMAGSGDPYNYLPFFYSDLFDLGYEAVGEIDSRLQTVADWQEPYQKGVVYYLRDGRVRGVLLWNVWDMVPTARDLIAEAGPFKPEDLKGRIG